MYSYKTYIYIQAIIFTLTTLESPIHNNTHNQFCGIIASVSNHTSREKTQRPYKKTLSNLNTA